MNLSLPPPISLDYPFGVGLVGGPAYVKFGNIEHTVAVGKHLRSQCLRVECVSRSCGEDRKGEKMREQRPESLADIGLKPTPRELLGRAGPAH